MITISKKDIEFSHPCAIAIGKFEGLHLGHQALLLETRSQAAALKIPVLVFTFSPHPRCVLSGERYQSIFSDPEKAAILEKMGVDIMIEYPFDLSAANMQPEEFASFIFEKLKCRALVIGKNFTFGKGGAGGAPLLKSIGGKCGASVTTLESVMSDGEKVSSSRIRAALMEKDFQSAAALMGRPYFISGEVSHGRELGRTLGFPTINLIPDPEKLLPINGVYMTKTKYDGELFNSMTNIGVNPTVKGMRKMVETYIFGFDRWIYGESVQVFFLEWMRGETKFCSVEMLKSQLESDVIQCERRFGACRRENCLQGV
ncbi:MAG: bifunctional riboflavin kinase/FAD synthetase [Clostridiales bacterium]|jgi:riboflavin kinase/FMN adenylyltransferase|nr:bifunctional riboflavin kinase/FAD synthetase [Clostridiales bacterium]